MLLVVDAEVIFAALIARGFTLQIIKVLVENEVELISPEYVFEEINNRKRKITKLSGLSEVELHFLLSVIFEKIKVISKDEYLQHLEEAEKLAPHKRDAPYFALAIAKNAGIWSNEKSFRKQSDVRIFSTTELKMLFEKGDYTKERSQWLKESINEIVDEIKKKRKSQ